MRARTEEAKDERRQLLLGAALEEFSERGFAAARMDDIARRAGFSKGTLYLYFTSKEDLFFGLVDVIATPRIEAMEAAASRAASVREALSMMLSMVPFILRHSDLPRILKILISDGVRFPHVTQTYRERIVERGLGLIAGLLERGHRRGELHADDPALTARLVVAPMIMSGIWKILFESDGKETVDLDALMALHKTMLFRALRMKEPEEDST